MILVRMNKARLIGTDRIFFFSDEVLQNTISPLWEKYGKQNIPKSYFLSKGCREYDPALDDLIELKNSVQICDLEFLKDAEVRLIKPDQT